MYTATMHYSFKEEYLEEACALWKKQVLDLALKQAGFIRMQFLLSGTEALAIGTWEEKQYAQAFMQSGVFKQLMEKLETMVTAPPRPRIWELKYFEEK